MRLRLEICDVRGRLIRVLHDGLLVAGDHVMNWDGRLDNGRSAPSGLYMARIRDDVGHSQTRRMMLVK
jgi:flagellar hook assembly protein FlgD